MTTISPCPSPEVKAPFREKTGKLTRSERQELKVSGPLDYELQRLGIQPFNTESVYKYMAQKVDALKNPKPGIAYGSADHLMASTLEGLSFMGFLFSFILFSFAMKLINHAGLITCVAILILIISMMFAKLERTLEKKMEIAVVSPRPNAEWRTIPLADYLLSGRQTLFYSHTTPVPPEVMRMAERVASIPHTELVVHYLYNDPFLEVRYLPPKGASSSRMIALWDEEGFVH